MAEPWVVLLRGVNVGGHHKLPMASLRSLLEELGCEAPKTLIASGNAVVDCSAEAAATLDDRLETAIGERFGFDVPVVVRPRAALARAVDACPFVDEATEDPRLVHVGFLAGEVDAEVLAALPPDPYPPDRFRIVDQVLYSHFPRGSARSKLGATWFDRRLGVPSTWRNWRTTVRLLDLALAR